VARESPGSAEALAAIVGAAVARRLSADVLPIVARHARAVATV
jgi:hypothetical protein